MKVMLFGASWCEPCKALKPTFAEIMDEVAGVEFEYIDVDGNAELRRKYKVMSVPTMIFERDGEVVDRLVGLQPKDRIIEKMFER